MALLSARRREAADALAVYVQLQRSPDQATELHEVAMTPRRESRGLSPRPVIRGPQGSSSEPMTSEVEAKIEKAFLRYDTAKTGEVDMMVFEQLCADLELPMDHHIARRWLAGRSEGSGLSLKDVKQLYGRILAAQSPAVRTMASHKPLRLKEACGTESQMRAAFKRYAVDGFMTLDDLAGALMYLGFPDTYCDKFDRFVGDWAALRGKDSNVDFHDFVNCVNLLVDFCERQLEEQQQQP
mmetsp:Transcript_2044/g.4934  ORF Transcript_2044/g.4934 Transcript_2044/m.4934 type:complete len:240 (+) Transcript_2044:91-810(+)